MREGYGEMHWKDGTIYKGEWKQGNQAGYGKIKKASQALFPRNHNGSSSGESIDQSEMVYFYQKIFGNKLVYTGKTQNS